MNLYAVVKAGGRQYRVAPGDSFSVEKIEGAPGTALDLKEVLMVGGPQVVLGTPFVSGAVVKVVVEEQFRGPKIFVFKKKRRNNYKKARGHRSELTKLFVSEIVSPSGGAKAETKPFVKDPNREKKVRAKSEGELEEKRAAKASASTPAKKKTASKKKAGARKSSKKTKSKK